MPNPRLVRDLVVRWHERSKSNELEVKDIFDRFICLWIAFNAWGNGVTRTDQDAQMIDELARDPQLREVFGRCLKEPGFRERVAEIKGRGIPRYGLDRRGMLRTPFVLADETSLDQVLHAAYYIRCNLFHGRKVPSDEWDVILVDWAYFVVGRIFDEIIG